MSRSAQHRRMSSITLLNLSPAAGAVVRDDLAEPLAERRRWNLVEMLSEGRDGEEQMQLLAAVARRGRHRDLALLQVVGSSNPDRVVSKFARKEAFRLRSKLASTSNG